MPISVDSPNSQITEEELRALEERLDLVLPSDYRFFLLKKNGGRCSVAARFRDLSDTRELSAIDTFLSASGSADASLEDAYARIFDLLPNGLIPIAFDEGGNYLLLDCIAGPTAGWIFFATLESLSEIDEPQREHLNAVARSFADLTQKIGLTY